MVEPFETDSFNEQTHDWSIESLQEFGLTQDQAAITLMFRELVLPYYEPASDYHNEYEHITESFFDAMSLCLKAKQEGHDPDIFTVALAMIGHDAGYNHDLFNVYDTGKWIPKETYHAHISATLLETMKDGKLVTDSLIQSVKERIITTNADAKCETIEDEIMCMADISNVQNQYENFVLKSCQFLRESILRGADIDLDIFRKIAGVILGKYLSRIKILKNLDQDEDGKSRIERGYVNIERFSLESPQEIISILGKKAAQFANVLLRKVSADSND